MKINKTYRSLLDKSINSMLSAIEIYNKPDFNYREETFAILAVNSWELLFKAQLLKLSKYNMNALYEMEFVKILEDYGVTVTVRDTRGREIDGACGQLAAAEKV